MIVSFPTGKDIYIEIDGRRLAVAQGYKARTARESRYIEAFGAEEPVGTVGGKSKHVLELTRVYVTDKAFGDTIDFHCIDNFNVVIVKPDRKIIYSGCQWSSISEAATVHDMMFETVTIVATKRMEVR